MDANDCVCVWIQDGTVYAGIKRIYYSYDAAYNTGYVVKEFGYFDKVDEYKDDALLLALDVSTKAGLPMKQKWE
jgi:hypothetical protein